MRRFQHMLLWHELLCVLHAYKHNKGQKASCWKACFLCGLVHDSHERLSMNTRSEHLAGRKQVLTCSRQSVKALGFSGLRQFVLSALCVFDTNLSLTVSAWYVALQAGLHRARACCLLSWEAWLVAGLAVSHTLANS